MSVMQECPDCHRKQTLRNRKCTVCDSDLFKARKSKRVRYHVAYRVPGSRKLYFENAGESLDDAKALAAEKRVAKKERRLFPTNDMTFKKLAEWYLKLNKVTSLSMAGAIEIHLNRFNNKFGDVKVDKLKKSMLADFQVGLQQEGLSSSYIDQIIGTARTMVNLAIDDEDISPYCIRPFKKIGKLLKKNANARDLIFTHEQYEKFMSLAPFHVRPIFATGYWTGMRRNEILELTWDKVFKKERCIRLTDKDTKDDEPRVIPIFQPLFNILEKVPRAIKDNHVFLYRGTPLVNFREAFRLGMKKAGIPFGRTTPGGLTFHDLRHTFNTNMRKAGVPEKLIMKITGHSTREMFDRYNTITPDEINAIEAPFLNQFINQSKSKKENG